LSDQAPRTGEQPSLSSGLKGLTAGGAGAALAETPLVNIARTDLELGMNAMGESTGRALEEALLVNTALHWLDITGNSSGPEAVNLHSNL
jgi:hypothetical protein